jgi:hypothetical protein
MARYGMDVSACQCQCLCYSETNAAGGTGNQYTLIEKGF